MMNPLIRWTVLGAVVCALALSVRWAAPGLATDLGVDFWAMSELQHQLEQEAKIDKDLSVRNELVQVRIRAKTELVRDLIDGQQSLLEVACRFRKMNAGCEDYRSVIDLLYEGRTYDEKVCRNVIGHVESYLDENPSLRAEVSARMHAELDRALESGPITLP
jgi:hypothetical protein